MATIIHIKRCSKCKKRKTIDMFYNISKDNASLLQLANQYIMRGVQSSLPGRI